MLTNNSFIVGMTHDDGRGNDVNIEATGSVLIDGGSWIDNRVWGNGDGGNITIRAGDSITLDGSGSTDPDSTEGTRRRCRR